MARCASHWMLICLALAVSPANAQFVFKKPEINLPVPPPIVLNEEGEPVEPEVTEEEPSYPVYEGSEIALTTSCKINRLEYAGIRCSADQPCDFFLDLVSIAGMGDWVVLAGEIHTADATYESVVLSSSDGGLTWKETAERVAAGGIEAIAVVDPENAFIAGQQGDTATEEKPFLLVTDDGGESWDVRMVEAGSAESQGLVVDFQAENAKHGYLVLEQLASTGDPYRLYETFNGGRSWSIRQISAEKPQTPGPRISLKRENWRLRPDSAASQHVVAARSSSEISGWADKLRFNVAAGTCP